MNDAPLDKMDTEESTADADWDNRRLCSDGNCIGVIGPDGCCKVCGLPYAGELPDSSTQAPATEDSRETALPLAQENKATSEDTLDEEADPDWDNRRLCSDGNCIGVIGPDGCCKVCGLPYRP